MNWNERIPGVASFTWGEFFVTDFNEARLRQEFLALPKTEQDKIKENIIRIAHRLQVIRDFYNRPVTVTSGWRSLRVNRLVGGVDNSSHTRGEAADITVEGVTPRQVQRDFRNWRGGLGLGDTFTHFDVWVARPPFDY